MFFDLSFPLFLFIFCPITLVDRESVSEGSLAIRSTKPKSPDKESCGLIRDRVKKADHDETAGRRWLKVHSPREVQLYEGTHHTRELIYRALNSTANPKTWTQVSEGRHIWRQTADKLRDASMSWQGIDLNSFSIASKISDERNTAFLAISPRGHINTIHRKLSARHQTS
jgi:hypothetical protein